MFCPLECKKMKIAQHGCEAQMRIPRIARGVAPVGLPAAMLPVYPSPVIPAITIYNDDLMSNGAGILTRTIPAAGKVHVTFTLHWDLINVSDPRLTASILVDSTTVRFGSWYYDYDHTGRTDILNLSMTITWGGHVTAGQVINTTTTASASVGSPIVVASGTTGMTITFVPD